MRAAIGIVLVGTWALVVAAVCGPAASVSQVSAVFLGGLLAALSVWFVVTQIVIGPCDCLQYHPWWYCVIAWIC